MKKWLIFWFVTTLLVIACMKFTDTADMVGTSAAITGALPIEPTGSWYTYGANSQNTGASNGSLYTLQYKWSYSPSLVSDYNTLPATIVADKNFIYYKRDKYDPDWAPSGLNLITLVHKVDNTGVERWESSKLGANASRGFWPAMVYDQIVVSEDGMWAVPQSTGIKPITSGGLCCDYWGGVTTYGNNFIVTNSYQVETKQTIFLSYNSSNLGELWRINYNTNGDNNRSKPIVDSDVIFFNPLFSNSIDYQYDISGVYAYNINGTLKWFKSTIPSGRMSVQNGKLFSFENTLLVCRSTVDGSVLWSQNVGSYIKSQPCVLADGMCIVATGNGITAYNQDTGFPIWVKNIPNIVPAPSYEQTTVMAAATGSKTLVVTSDDGVYLINYITGTQVDFIQPPVGIGRRTGNPIIVEGSLYLIGFNINYGNYPNTNLICLRDINYTAPTPPQDSVIVPPPPPPPSPTVTLSGKLQKDQRTHTLNWTYSNIVANKQVLQRNLGTGWTLLYQGNSPYSYIPAILNSINYRVIINDTLISNIVSVKSKKR